MKRGTTSLLKEFTQKKLAEAWSEEPPEIAIADLASDYALGDTWPDEAIRIMAVDVQHHHNRAGLNVQTKLDYSGVSAGLCLIIIR